MRGQVQYEDNRLGAPGPLLGEHAFQPFALLPERAERIAECYRPVGACDDPPSALDLRTPAERRLDDDRQACFRRTDYALVAERLLVHAIAGEMGEQVIAAAEEQLADMNYLVSINRYPDGDRLRYEKAMLDDWFEKRIAKR